MGTGGFAGRSALPLQPQDELRHALNRADLAAEHIPLRVGCDAFTHGAVSSHARWALGHVLGNEEPHLAGLCAAYAEALSPARIVVVVGLRIDGVQNVLSVDVKPADAAELIPGVEVLTFLIEDLDAAVTAVGCKEAAARIHGERVRTAKFARSITE